MCILCNELWTEDHWTEVSADASRASSDSTVAFETHVDRRGRRLRDRSRRTRLVSAVLDGYGLQLEDWEGSAYILRDAKGQVAIVHDLAAVWTEAERITGRPFDPLEPTFLGRMRSKAGPV